MSDCIYNSSEGEFVDFETLDDWEQRDKAKNARISALEAQLAQRDAALKAADELADAIRDCQCNGGIEESILGYCPAKRLDAAQDAYDKTRGQDA